MKPIRAVLRRVFLLVLGVHAGVVAAAFNLDLSGSESVLRHQPADARREQIADWVVLALLQERTPAEVGAATFDRPPVRSAWMDPILDQPFGGARVVAVSEEEAWIVAPADAPDLRTLVGRQADQLVSGTAVQPKRVKVFLYRAGDGHWSVAVDDPLEFDAEQVWGEPFDYLTATVTQPSQIGAWLGAGRDLATLRQTNEGVALGGRQFCPAKGLQFDLKDVATIMSARLQLDNASGKTEQRLQQLDAESKAAVNAYNALVAVANRGFGEANRNRGTPSAATAAQFKRDASALAGRLGESLNAGALDDVDRWKSAVEQLSTAVDRKHEGLREQAAEELRQDGPQPADPGFSLDPLLDVARLRENLASTESDPAAPVRRAVAKAAEVWQKHRRDDISARPRAAWLAMDLLTAVAQESISGATPEAVALLEQTMARAEEANRVGDIAKFDAATREVADSGMRAARTWRAPDELGDSASRLAAVLRDGSTRADAEEALWTVRQTLRSLDGSGIEAAALELLVADAEVQCARYDGALDGSDVGMTLFYTDTIAKMWAALDYGRTLPSREILGIPSHPTLDGIPAVYAGELMAKSATRMWFGARESAALGKPEDATGLQLPAVYARVFAKGSDGGFRPLEAVPNEASRRVFDWWDQHFLDIARYEPQYERLNQIMKWSLVSVWMAGRENFNQVETWNALVDDRQRRWDRWVTSNGQLKFRTPLPLTSVPKLSERGLECFPLFRSRLFHPIDGLTSRISYMEGGVSLVERGKVKNALGSPVPDATVAVPYRRSALRNTSGAAATNSRETTIVHLQSGGAEQFVYRPSASLPMTAGETHLKPQQVTLAVSRADAALQLDATIRSGSRTLSTSSVQVARVGDDVRVHADAGDLGRLQRAMARIGAPGAGTEPGTTVFSLDRGKDGYLLGIDGNASAPELRRWFLVGGSLSAVADSLVSWSQRDIQPLTKDEADATVRKYGYQVLFVDGGEIRRDLRNDAPPASAAATTVRWNNPALPQKVWRAEGGELIVQRPADPLDAEAFRDLVDYEGLTSRFVTDALTQTGAGVLAPDMPAAESIALRLLFGSPAENARVVGQTRDPELLRSARERAQALRQISPTLTQELRRSGVATSLDSTAGEMLQYVLRSDVAAFEAALPRADASVVLALLRTLERHNLTSSATSVYWSDSTIRDRLALVLVDGRVYSELSVSEANFKTLPAGRVITSDRGAVYYPQRDGTPVFATTATTLRFELADPVVARAVQRAREATGNAADHRPGFIAKGGERYVVGAGIDGGASGGGGGAGASGAAAASIFLGVRAESSETTTCPLPPVLRKAS